MKYGIYIGAEKAAITEARRTLLEILKCQTADAVKIAALETLRKLCNVENTTISNSTFKG